MTQSLEWRTILSRVACAALFVTGAIAVANGPVFSQAATESNQNIKEEDIAKELDKQAAEGGCKVIRAGFAPFVFGPTMAVVQAKCGDQVRSRHFSKEREQAMLAVALTALSTGKRVFLGGTLSDPTFFIEE